MGICCCSLISRDQLPVRTGLHPLKRNAGVVPDGLPGHRLLTHQYRYALVSGLVNVRLPLFNRGDDGAENRFLLWLHGMYSAMKPSHTMSFAVPVPFSPVTTTVVSAVSVMV